jgi:hypothetical protein
MAELAGLAAIAVVCLTRWVRGAAAGLIALGIVLLGWILARICSEPTARGLGMGFFLGVPFAVAVSVYHDRRSRATRDQSRNIQDERGSASFAGDDLVAGKEAGNSKEPQR